MVMVEVIKRETSVTGSRLCKGDVVDVSEEFFKKYSCEFRLVGRVTKKRVLKEYDEGLLEREKKEKDLADELGECLKKKKASFFMGE